MLKIKNKVINLPIITIVEKIKDYAQKNGVVVFNDIIDKDNDINLTVTCPNSMHKNRCERHPSCSILKEDKVDLYGETHPAGTIHCFSCGYTATLDELISDFMMQDDGGEFGRRWLLEMFGDASEEVRDELTFDFDRNNKRPGVKYITEEELDSYRYTHPYLYRRKMTDEIIEKFDLGYDKNTKTVTFPVNDIYGNCVFVARRSVEGKFFSYPSGSEKPVYLLDHIVKNRIKEIHVCESAFNALTLWCYGIPAVALFGTGSANQYELLNSCGVRSYVLCFDGDRAGDIGKSKFVKNIKGALIYSVDIPRGKDVNDLTKEEFESLEKHLEK